jgi:hypothetical protein
LVVDYSPINQVTRPASHPMPFIEHVLTSVRGSTHFSLFDAKKGYYQQELEEETKEKLCILFPDGLNKPMRLIPGPRNATCHFQAQMMRVFQGCGYTWLDDTLTHSRGFAQCVTDLRENLARLKVARVRLNLKKSQLITKEAKFLGRVFTGNGVTIDPVKIQGLEDLPRPTSVADLSSVLNSLNWSRTSIPDYARLRNSQERWCMWTTCILVVVCLKSCWS